MSSGTPIGSGPGGFYDTAVPLLSARPSVPDYVSRDRQDCAEGDTGPGRTDPSQRRDRLLHRQPKGL